VLPHERGRRSLFLMTKTSCVLAAMLFAFCMAQPGTVHATLGGPEVASILGWSPGRSQVLLHSPLRGRIRPAPSHLLSRSQVFSP